MEETTIPSPAPVPTPVPPQAQAPLQQPMPMICPQCHQPIKPEYYFCPNCGKKLSEPGLSTTVSAQVMLYAFSIVLPIIAYLAITKWEGITYARSADPKAQQMGWIAIGLLTVSSIIVLWWTTAWIDGFIKAQTSTVGLSEYGL